MLRILIVSPHFPPVSSADMQRVRMLLPYLQENGCQVEVLSVDPGAVESPLDPWLQEGLPPEVVVHRVPVPGKPWSRLPGLGTLGFRAIPPLARAGNRLLRTGHFDLVYFSTTVFETHILGPLWKRLFGVPYVMDYQDAWVSDYYALRPENAPPGGRLKYAVIRRIHRWMEPRVLRDCSGLTSVSPDYPRQLATRYPKATLPRVLVQGFPGASRDFDRLPETPAGPLPFDPAGGGRHWVYVGRGGEDMALAASALFEALAQARAAGRDTDVRMHFIGTSYARSGSGRKTFEPLAQERGVGDVVSEQTDRIGYGTTLWCLRNADALMVPGSDDPAYTASKIYPYLLAGKPLLAIFHRRSTVVELFRRAGGGVCVPFDDGDSVATLATRIGRQWFDKADDARRVPLDQDAFHPFTDVACAAEFTGFLRLCLEDARR
ncbi:glycosyltransferase [Luteimonas vadosa]|uniref:Glycosyltransferase subfamily 4-like N-terminal domain-containing protein n=1 Tax=Luteimonas vadosa TaxID=1165507 RepID=A0ABP9DS24_9GAMM